MSDLKPYAFAFTRRQAIAAGASMLLPLPVRAQAVPRIAAIDWAMLETALALGAPPAAATELVQFRKIAIEPAVPESVVDLGLRGTPNYELLRMVAPELILITGFYEYQRARLERIAPVLSVPLFQPGSPPYGRAEEAARVLGARLGREAVGEHLVGSVREEIERCRARLGGLDGRPVFAISLGDSRHFRAFGSDSMFGDVLGRLGLRNAWDQPTSYRALAGVGIEALAAVPQAAIAIIEPTPPEVNRTLPGNALWNALPAVCEGRVATLPPISHFGGLIAARRFARLLTDAFAPQDHRSDG
jgi:iron complex transport system substrate-binding protein